MSDEPQEAGEPSPSPRRAGPPKHTQFKKGQSGNLKGRPKGSLNLTTIIKRAAHAPVTVTIEGKQRTITKVMATAIQLANKAASGEMRAMAKLFEWMDEIERRAAAARPAEFPLSEVDLEVLHAIHERMQQCTPENPAE